MASLLPRYFALKSNNNRKCLRYIDQVVENLHGVLQFSEEDFNSPYARFEMETANNGDGSYVHIKSRWNNKYLRRADDQHWWIVAGADEPEESENLWSCTLFKPVAVHAHNNLVLLRLQHVQLGHYVKLFSANAFRSCLFAHQPNPDHQMMDAYTVIDLVPVGIPNHFVLKSNNNDRYLRYKLDEDIINREILQFTAVEPTNPDTKFQIELANSRENQDNHYVHIKCSHNNKYFRRLDQNNLLILAAADQRDEDKRRWSCTLFKPELVGQADKDNNNVLCRLQHVQSSLYTRPFIESRLELRLNQLSPDLQELDVYTASPVQEPTSLP
ncbi:uncharacterized protein LOC125479098 [Pyrus x bretschneideri]|uniref:uncharacterized protein LOC125479098 n=1 Tax=Pyrus x bretschneideri TaxID=225117 RepID=UPI00051171B2|nr:uncharacterized protein LOC125479098 [Pyrus x bretschneideri]